MIFANYNESIGIQIYPGPCLLLDPVRKAGTMENRREVALFENSYCDPFIRNCFRKAVSRI